jgi:hypothetical protein
MVEIVNPETGRKVSIYGTKGQDVLCRYLNHYEMSGGAKKNSPSSSNQAKKFLRKIGREGSSLVKKGSRFIKSKMNSSRGKTSKAPARGGSPGKLKIEDCNKGVFKNEAKGAKGKKTDCTKFKTKGPCNKEMPACSFYDKPPKGWDEKALGKWSKCATALHNSCQTDNLKVHIEKKDKDKLKKDKAKAAATIKADKEKVYAQKMKAKAADDKLKAMEDAKKKKEAARKAAIDKCKGSCSPDHICPLAGYTKAAAAGGGYSDTESSLW